MNIILTGFMGTGKSAVSKLLAEKLSWQYIDTDEIIEKEQGVPISAIFATKGEPYFREIESAAIRRISALDKVVISCGGGVVLKKENMDELEKNGFIICLTASPEKIYGRVKHNTDRPLLKVDNPLQKINELLELRKPFYSRCSLMIDTTDLPVSGVVEKIMERGIGVRLY